MPGFVIVASVAGEPVYWGGEQQWFGDPAKAIVFHTPKDADDVLPTAQVVCPGAVVEKAPKDKDATNDD